MNERIHRLCEEAKTGDITAASELVTLFHQRIYAYFRRLTGNDAEAADLTQKTFFKSWLSLESFHGASTFSTWLHGIAHHVYLDWRRRPNRAEPVPDAWWDTCATPTPDPFQDAAERDTARQLYAAVDRLDHDTRETVHLHYFQGLTLAETAETLEIAVSTVKYRLREAVQKLKRQMTEERAVHPLN